LTSDQRAVVASLIAGDLTMAFEMGYPLFPVPGLTD
jgi:hypothetical protein